MDRLAGHHNPKQVHREFVTLDRKNHEHLVNLVGVVMATDLPRLHDDGTMGAICLDPAGWPPAPRCKNTGHPAPCAQ